MLVTVTLGWPPTANTYWRRNGNRYFISPKGMAYRKATSISCLPYKDSFPIEHRLRVNIHASPPDRRRRDLDNICKCLLDSLQHGGLYVDDSQIDILYIVRTSFLSGQVIVTIESI